MVLSKEEKYTKLEVKIKRHVSENPDKWGNGPGRPGFIYGIMGTYQIRIIPRHSIPAHLVVRDLKYQATFFEYSDEEDNSSRIDELYRFMDGEIGRHLLESRNTKLEEFDSFLDE